MGEVQQGDQKFGFTEGFSRQLDDRRCDPNHSPLEMVRLVGAQAWRRSGSACLKRPQTLATTSPDRVPIGACGAQLEAFPLDWPFAADRASSTSRRSIFTSSARRLLRSSFHPGRQNVTWPAGGEFSGDHSSFSSLRVRSPTIVGLSNSDQMPKQLNTVVVDNGRCPVCSSPSILSSRICGFDPCLSGAVVVRMLLIWIGYGGTRYS